MRTLEKAKSLLKEDAAVTCVLINGTEVYCSEKHGVAPLIEFIDSDKSFKGFSAADRIVGKAAALLYSYMGISELYADVMSKAAVNVLKEHNISFEYGELVENIMNRRSDGMCPMELTVASENSPSNAVVLLKNKIKSMREAANNVK